VYLHRWIVSLIDGPEAIEGRDVMHLCDNPSCYRYDHLRVGTRSDNVNDMLAKGRSHHQKKTHCDHGHEFSEANTRIVGRRRVCRTCERRRSLASYHRRRNSVTPAVQNG
jgi:hypothetical protein